MSESKKRPGKSVKEVDQVTIRFAGDSGDGMQLTGSQFTETTGIVGNDLATLPDYPAEIRAPAGSLAGVSSFQIQFGHEDIQTPGDQPDVLVVMNPAALKVNLPELRRHGIIIANKSTFNTRNLDLAEWDVNPLEGDALLEYTVVSIDMTLMVEKALEGLRLTSKEVARSTNMFALGLLYWMYDRPIENTIEFIEAKFKSRPEIVEANKRALQAGYNFGGTNRLIQTSYRVSKADLPPGTYRNIMGNHAVALGLVAASQKSKLPLFYASYPITPASDILHMISHYHNFGIITFQAEDEIAAVTSAIGASFAGSLAVTGTSGPGMALMTEAIGLAVAAELPLVLVNVQRAGPSTGLPTKTEQADLFQAMYGRNAETPVVVLAAATPSDCFSMVYEACRIAVRHMVPVILLSDTYLGSGSEPWRLARLEDLPPIENHMITDTNGSFHPFEIVDPKTMARGWAVPGTPGLEHRIGGLEKDAVTGEVNYEAENHEQMVRRRQKKVDVVAEYIPPVATFGDESGNLLVLGWGSTYGAIRATVETVREKGHPVSHLHLRHLNPFPKNLGDVLVKFRRILVPEINLGQLARIIRSEYLIDTISYNKVQGKPFTTGEIEEKVMELLKETEDA
ncbi:MAG: 2-oxoacid:acceptor oxidoreductase subunit alpha [Fidelibacterota bacterium]|nr:MAG: 2-oxoacid:acceptor oxidoreductase subunit alpha [Candidatus Neomarinimicrobiota bacterium]